jgi:uncharacterized protein
MTRRIRCRTIDSGARVRAFASNTRDSVIASGVLAAEQIGRKQSITPEGFLLCEEVPIARVGSQDYAYFELPELEAKDGVIVADRTADVLFSAETLASFEGKPITIDHPPDFVTPANYMSVARGTVRNVRRGEGAQSDLMLADLLITDAEAIRRVQSKDLNQVSNGYDAEYEQIAPGRARQTNIVGNHVALVKSARCGPVCSIGDSAANLKRTQTHQRVDINARNRAFWAAQLGHTKNVDQHAQTGDSTSRTLDINEIHRRFWAPH